MHPGDPFLHCHLRCQPGDLWLEVTNNQGARVTQLVQCRKCTIIFEDPRPSRNEIDAFYENNDLWLRSTDAEGKPRSYIREIGSKKPFFTNLANRINKRKTSGKLLDIGSGLGLLEASLDKSRWEVTGLDLSKYIADFGRDNLGTNVMHSRFEDADLPLEYFDVIVMKYTLDHMEEPFAALQKARRLIKPDGLLVIADLININSIAARLFGEGHRLIHPMHFTYFCPETITFHLKRAGFGVRKIEYPYFDTSYFTVQNVSLFFLRGIRRWIDKYFMSRPKRIYSTPFYGSLMDVWAVPL